MRILMLAQFYAPIIGGEERLVQDLSVELVKRGYEVAVATLWHRELAEYELNQGVRVYRLRSTTQRARWLYTEMGRRHAPPCPDPELMWGLRQVIAREQPQIVHAHNWLGYSFLPLKSWSRARFVLTLHDYSLVCAMKRLMYRGALCNRAGFTKCLACAWDHYGGTKGILTTLSNSLMGAVERANVDMFLPVSEAVALANGLAGGHWPYQVIPNFVPDGLGEPGGEAAPHLAHLPAEGYLLFAGDLSDDKGTGVLLRAYGDLVDPPPLVLIGKRLPDKLPVVAGNVTVVTGWPHDAVMEAWRRCSIALVPSVWAEPFGLVALEAMAVGRPVIASRTGGLADIVVDGETGLLVRPGDPSALGQAIERLLRDPALRERMGQAGKRRVAEFRASNIVPRIERVYQVVSEPREAARRGEQQSKKDHRYRGDEDA